MNKHNYAKILLSSQERKAVFRAAQSVFTSERNQYSELAHRLCVELDDGGIWNPTFLIVVPDVENKHPDTGSVYPVGVILTHGINTLAEFEHELRMVKDRLLYTSSRNNGPKPQTAPRPPFFSQSNYYGPDWDSVREQAIKRDGGECVNCSISRESHHDTYGTDLHVHHKRPLREVRSYEEANQLDNLVTLCRRCHFIVEQQEERSKVNFL